MSFYTDEELAKFGFASLGRNVRLSRRASIHRAGRISIGDYSRIDDYCVLSAGDGGIDIGSRVHIGVMATLIGAGRISLGDMSTLSGRVSVYSSSDDYGGEFMTNPTIPTELTNVDTRPVLMGRHVIVGSGSVVLPGAQLADGVAVGALSLVSARLEQNGVYAGVPAKRLKERRTGMYELERQLLQIE